MTDWLNYHHLYYFWMTARLGSISAAAGELSLSRPTVSAQLKQLEQSLGQPLFDRSARRVELTEFGHTVFRHADHIFTAGKELQDVVAVRVTDRPTRFRVGTPDALPKLIAYRLLRPTLKLQQDFRVICVEGKLDELLADLAVHRLDLVLSDGPVSPAVSVKAYNHLLGESGVSFFAAPPVASRCQRAFPGCLEELPLLLPIEATTIRRSLDQWFEQLDLRPHIKAEFEDSALMKVFGQAGEGVFPAPSAIADDVCRQYQVQILGHVETVREQFYAISVERRLKHPAVLEISRTAQDLLSKSQGGFRH